MCYLLPGQCADPEKRFLIHDWYGFGGSRPHYEVFGAEDRRTNEIVLVKVFPMAEWERGAPSTDLGRIRRLEHASLIRPLDFGTVADDACPFYTGPLMYVVEPAQTGVSLETFLEEEPSAREVEPIAESIVDGLRYLRQEWGLCDIPPREILLVGKTTPRWSLVGAENCEGDTQPNVLRTIARRYPPLAERLTV